MMSLKVIIVALAIFQASLALPAPQGSEMQIDKIKDKIHKGLEKVVSTAKTVIDKIKDALQKGAEKAADVGEQGTELANKALQKVLEIADKGMKEGSALLERALDKIENLRVQMPGIVNNALKKFDEQSKAAIEKAKVQVSKMIANAKLHGGKGLEKLSVKIAEIYNNLQQQIGQQAKAAIEYIKNNSGKLESTSDKIIGMLKGVTQSVLG